MLLPEVPQVLSLRLPHSVHTSFLQYALSLSFLFPHFRLFSFLSVLLPVQPFYLLFHVRKTGSAVMRWSRHKSSINSWLPRQTSDLISIQIQDTTLRPQVESLLHYKRMPRTDFRGYSEALPGLGGWPPEHPADGS